MNAEKIIHALLNIFLVRWIVGIDERHRIQQFRILFQEQKVYYVAHTLFARRNPSLEPGEGD